MVSQVHDPSQQEIESSFEYANLDCLVCIDWMGYRYGYVGVPPRSLLFARSVTDANLTHVDVPGGVSFVGSLENLGISKTWFFGFGCNGPQDAPDPTSKQARQAFALDEEFSMSFFLGRRVWRRSEVELQTRILAMAIDRQQLTSEPRRSITANTLPKPHQHLGIYTDG